MISKLVLPSLLLIVGISSQAIAQETAPDPFATPPPSVTLTTTTTLPVPTTTLAKPTTTTAASAVLPKPAAKKAAAKSVTTPVAVLPVVAPAIPSCLVVRATQTLNNANGDSVTVNTGRLAKYQRAEEDDGTLDLVLPEGIFPIDRKSVVIKPGIDCVKSPSCFEPTKNVKTFRFDGARFQNFGSLTAETQYEIIGSSRQKSGKRFVIVQLTSEENVWVSERTGKVTKESCKDAKAGAISEKVSRFRMSFNIGLTSNRLTKGFENLLTDIPDSNDVGSLRTPLMTETQKGKGEFLDACARYRFGASYGLQGCGFYEQFKVTSTGKTNADVGVGVSYDSLPDTSLTYVVQTFGFGASAYYEYRPTWKHGLTAGFGPRASYIISKQSPFEFYTGTIFKATRNEVPTGPQGILTTLAMYFEYDYRLNKGLNGIKVGYAQDNQSQKFIYFGFEL